MVSSFPSAAVYQCHTGSTRQNPFWLSAPLLHDCEPSTATSSTLHSVSVLSRPGWELGWGSRLIYMFAFVLVGFRVMHSKLIVTRFLFLFQCPGSWYIDRHHGTFPCTDWSKPLTSPVGPVTHHSFFCAWPETCNSKFSLRFSIHHQQISPRVLLTLIVGTKCITSLTDNISQRNGKKLSRGWWLLPAHCA